MNFKKYENEVGLVNTDLLKKDEYCFSVLARILQSECRLTLTDNERFIICHSCDPYPVWIWLADDASDDEREFIYQTIKTYFGFDGSYRFNVTYDLADFLISRAKKDMYEIKISVNMLAYNCPSPIPPKNGAEGKCITATAKDIELVVDFMKQFHSEVLIDRLDVDTYRKKALSFIEDSRLFFWCDKNDEIVAMTSYVISDDKGSVGNVFTRRDKRRCGYASSLVYAITLKIQERGKMPTLYTDADYIASNACYEKIGYTKQGSLCTIIIKKEK